MYIECGAAAWQMSSATPDDVALDHREIFIDDRTMPPRILSILKQTSRATPLWTFAIDTSFFWKISEDCTS